eukprot:PhM_4_TR5954/c0_g1_i1/m.93601
MCRLSTAQDCSTANLPPPFADSSDCNAERLSISAGSVTRHSVKNWCLRAGSSVHFRSPRDAISSATSRSLPLTKTEKFSGWYVSSASCPSDTETTPPFTRLARISLGSGCVKTLEQICDSHGRQRPVGRPVECESLCIMCSRICWGVVIEEGASSPTLSPISFSGNTPFSSSMPSSWHTAVVSMHTGTMVRGVEHHRAKAALSFGSESKLLRASWAKMTLRTRSVARSTMSSSAWGCSRFTGMRRLRLWSPKRTFLQTRRLFPFVSTIAMPVIGTGIAFHVLRKASIFFVFVVLSGPRYTCMSYDTTARGKARDMLSMMLFTRRTVLSPNVAHCIPLFALMYDMEPTNGCIDATACCRDA